jgi:hypothetical protein
MEIGGYSVGSYLLLLGVLVVMGYVTSVIVVWLLTIRFDGKQWGPDYPPIRYRWVIHIIASVTYFILLGNAVGWQVTR